MADSVTTTTYYGKGGNTVEDEASCFAYHTISGTTNFYKILMYDGILHNPYNSSILRRSQRERIRMKKVNEQTFNNYLRFLKTKNEKYLTLARRGTIGE